MASLRIYQKKKQPKASVHVRNFKSYFSPPKIFLGKNLFFFTFFTPFFFKEKCKFYEFSVISLIKNKFPVFQQFSPKFSVSSKNTPCCTVQYFLIIQKNALKTKGVFYQAKNALFSRHFLLDKKLLLVFKVFFCMIKGSVQQGEFFDETENFGENC